MSAGTNTAGTLQHDANALRFRAPEIPAEHQGTSLGRWMEQLGENLARTLREGQRAFQTLSSGSVEVTVLKDFTSDGTNWTHVYIPIRVQAQGATNTSQISGTNCT